MGEIRGVTTGLALVVIALLIGMHVDVGVPGQSVLQTLRLHLTLASLLLPVIMFLIGARWRAGLLAIAILASAAPVAWVLWQQHGRRDALIDLPVASAFQFVSFNVLASNEQPGDIVDYLTAQPVEIAVILEAPGIQPLFSRLAVTYPYRAGCGDQQVCDTAILSRSPLSNIRVIQIGEFRRYRLIVATTDIDGQSVTIVAVHLTKPYFDSMASEELHQLASILRQLEGPVVLSGDFNDAAWSDALLSLAEDGALVPPPYPPATWPTEAGSFGIPIDNMFTRGNALITHIEAIPDAMGSNHRGLKAQVEVLASP